MKIGKARPKGLAGVTPVRKPGDPLPEGYVYGCPTKYRPEYCDAIIEYFSRNPWEVNTDAKGAAKVIPSEKLPTVIRWARQLGVGLRTVTEWTSRYPEFKQAHEIAMELQKAYILEAGGITLNGGFAMFMLKCNHGMLEPKHEEDEQVEGPIQRVVVEVVSANQNKGD